MWADLWKEIKEKFSLLKDTHYLLLKFFYNENILFMKTGKWPIFKTQIFHYANQLKK